METIRIPRQPRGAVGTKDVTSRHAKDMKRLYLDARHRDRAERQKRRNYRDAGSIPVPTAILIIEALPTIQKPSVRSVFGQLGVGEGSHKPAHRLSPRQGRRLRRRGVQVVQRAVNVLQAEQARVAKAARDAAAAAAVKEQCNARTKLGTRCRKSAVADGYCATHG
jgi:hypothetical protein